MGAFRLADTALFHRERLIWRTAARAFPIIQISDPRQSLADWTRFVRAHAKAGRGGVDTIEDERGYVHALFIWTVERHLTWRRTLRISTVVLAGFPGRALRDALLAAISRVAAELECDAIIIEPGDGQGGLEPQNLLASGYVQAPGAPFVRKLRPPMRE